MSNSLIQCIDEAGNILYQTRGGVVLVCDHGERLLMLSDCRQCDALIEAALLLTGTRGVGLDLI